MNFSPDCTTHKPDHNTLSLSDEARSKIMRCLNCGENPYTILAYAADCIGKLSGDTSFGERCRKTIGEVYVEGLADPCAAEIKKAGACRQERADKVCCMEHIRQRYKGAAYKLCTPH